MKSEQNTLEVEQSIWTRLMMLVGGTVLMGLGAWAIVWLYDATGSLLLSLGTGTAVGAACTSFGWESGSSVSPATPTEKTLWWVIFGPAFLVFPAVTFYEIGKAGDVEFGAGLVTLLFGALLGVTWKVLRS